MGCAFFGMWKITVIEDYPGVSLTSPRSFYEHRLAHHSPDFRQFYD